MAWPTTAFPSAQQILERLRDLAGNSRYSAICTVADFVAAGGVGGNSAEGRTMNYVRIGRQGLGTITPVKVVIIAGIHAREWAPPTAVTNVIEKLIEAFAAGTPLPIGGAPCSAQQVQSIIEKVDLYVAPMVNSDGYEWTRNSSGDRMWRKNRRPPPSSFPSGSVCTPTDPFRFGVDLNRNFDVLWDFPLHYTPAAAAGNLSKDPCDPQQVYIGQSAFSEVETQNVRFLLEKNPQFFVDVHMFGRDIYHAWGTAENDPIAGLTPQLDQTVLRDGFGGVVKDKINVDFLHEVERITSLMCDATGLATGTRYRPIAGAEQGAFGGASDDYSTSRNLPSVAGGPQPIRAFTIECGTDFVPQFTVEFPNIQKEVQAALIALLNYATTAAGRASLDPIPSGGGGGGPPPSSCGGCRGCSVAGDDDPSRDH